MLNAIELERDEQNKQIKSLGQKLEHEISENTNNKSALEETMQKLDNAKKTLAERPVAVPEQQQHEAQKTVKGGLGRRPRGAKEFFTGLQNAGGAQTVTRSGPSAGGNPTQIIQAATASEDMYVNIIQDLQADRMRMRGKDMTARLRNLQGDDSAFAKLIKQN